MWIKVILLWASLSVAVLCVEDQHATIRNAMEHLLQVRAPSTSSLPGEDSPHLYMMELYKKYLASESMKNRSNTIRSISPYRGNNLSLFFLGSCVLNLLTSLSKH